MQSERGRCSIRSANLGPGLARPPAPTAGAFFFGEFVTSADSFLLPHLRRRSHCRQAMVAPNKYLAQSNKSCTPGGRLRSETAAGTSYAAHSGERRHKSRSRRGISRLHKLALWTYTLPCAPGGYAVSEQIKTAGPDAGKA